MQVNVARHICKALEGGSTHMSLSCWLGGLVGRWQVLRVSQYNQEAHCLPLEL